MSFIRKFLPIINNKNKITWPCNYVVKPLSVKAVDWQSNSLRCHAKSTAERATPSSSSRFFSRCFLSLLSAAGKEPIYYSLLITMGS